VVSTKTAGDFPLISHITKAKHSRWFHLRSHRKSPLNSCPPKHRIKPFRTDSTKCIMFKIRALYSNTVCPLKYVMVGIIFTRGKHLHDRNISLRRGSVGP